MTSIPEFYSGKVVALTGGTGFVGECVIEKLLRSCPGIKQIYVLLRKKRNNSVEDRIEKLLNLPFFSNLRKEQPQFANKIVPISCNLEEEGLGLDEESVKILQSQVNIFIHSAATVRFDEPLKVAFKLNTLAVRSVIDLCKGMPQLEALVQVSTAYSQCTNRQVIKEEVYQTGWDFDKLYNAMLWMTDEMIKKITPDILGDVPNTYILTKALGEEVIIKEGKDLPICIVRPSSIGASYNEPLSGWSTNVNATSHLIIAVARGKIHSLPLSSQLNFDIIPVDFVTNGIIAAGRKTGLSHQKQKVISDSLNHSQNISSSGTLQHSITAVTDSFSVRRKTLPIYHLVVGTKNVTVKTWCDMVVKSSLTYPSNFVSRTPSLRLFNSKILHHLHRYAVDYIPAFFADRLLSIFMQKPTLMREQKRVSKAINVVYFFMSHQWEWEDKSLLKLQQEMSVEDQKEFNVVSHSIDWERYICDNVVGSKRYILKEDIKELPAARKRLMWIRFAGFAVKGLFLFSGICWYIKSYCC